MDGELTGDGSRGRPLTALDCLEEAREADDTLGVLPHGARGQLRTMAEDLSDLLDRVARESPVLAPLGDEEADAEAPLGP